MKFMNSMKKYGVGLALMSVGTSALAAVPAEVTTALTDAKADALSVGGIVLGIIVAIFALMLMRRVLK